MLSREVRILFRKEWRQLLRSRGAMATSLLLPLFLMVVLPALLLLVPPGKPPAAGAETMPSFLPGLAGVGADPRRGLALFLLPLLVAMTGVILPTMAAGYAVIQERETRTLELLIALPVRVGQILLAKLLAILALAGAATLTLFSVDALLVLVLGVGGLGWVLALLALLLCALLFSSGTALLVSLLAKDFRTAQNLTGLLVAPAIFVNMGFQMLVPGSPTLRLVLLAFLFSAAGLTSIAVALRVVTFERLLR